MSDMFTQAKFQISSAQNLESTGGIPSWAWLIIISFIILLVWWLLVRSAERQNEVQANFHDELSQAVGPMEESKSPEVKSNQISASDDLRLIEGIGPKVKSVLSGAGINTFSQLADTDPAILKSILDEAGFNYMDSTTWPEQARLLADGKQEEFDKLVSSLKGGRR